MRRSDQIPERRIQRQGISGRRARARWTTLDWAASFTISAFWHLVVLVVLTMTVHPFQLPDTRAINLEFLPPLTLPQMPTVELKLRPRQAEEEPKRTVVRPERQVLPKPLEVKPLAPAPQRQLLDVARPSQPELEKPVEVERRAVQTPRLQSQQAAPQVPEAPPEPVKVTPLAPALPQPVETPRQQTRAAPRLDTSRAAPQVPQAAPAPAPAPAAEAPIVTAPPTVAAPAQSAPQSAPLPVLTNESVVQAPVEIRPRDRAPTAPGLSGGRPNAPDIPIPGQGGAPPAGGQAGAAGGGQGGAGGRSGGGQIIGGFDAGPLKGLRMTRGCENPDAYKLTAEERAACLQRFAQTAKGVDLGLPISAANQARYDHYEACRRSMGGIAPSDSASEGTSIRGLGANPSLKDCGPSTR